MCSSDLALKFTKVGGVDVRLTVEEWEGADIAALRLDVFDSGSGFSPEMAKTLFDPYLRDKQHAATEGTGLGLSICKKLAEMFDGEVGCEGVPGSGAHFWIVLPLKVQKRRPDPAPVDFSGKAALYVGNGLSAALRDYFQSRGLRLVEMASVADIWATLDDSNQEFAF